MPRSAIARLTSRMEAARASGVGGEPEAGDCLMRFPLKKNARSKRGFIRIARVRSFFAAVDSPFRAEAMALSTKMGAQHSVVKAERVRERQAFSSSFLLPVACAMPRCSLPSE